MTIIKVKLLFLGFITPFLKDVCFRVIINIWNKNYNFCFIGFLPQIDTSNGFLAVGLGIEGTFDRLSDFLYHLFQDVAALENVEDASLNSVFEGFSSFSWPIIIFVIGFFLLFFTVYYIFYRSDKNLLEYVRYVIQQIKENLRPILIRYMLLREKVLLVLLTKNKLSSWILVRWFSCVMIYKYITQENLAHIPPEWFSIPTLFYGIVCTSTHHDGLFALSMVIIIRFEMSSLIISRFYQTRTDLLKQHFPRENTRSTWWRAAAQAAWESVDRLGRSAAIQTASFGLSGLAMWKYFDYRDTKLDAKQRQLDRDAENERTAKGIDAENERHAKGIDAEAQQRQLDRDAENERHAKGIDAEARQRQLDRDAEAKQRYLDRDPNVPAVEDDVD